MFSSVNKIRDDTTPEVITPMANILEELEDSKVVEVLPVPQSIDQDENIKTLKCLE